MTWLAEKTSCAYDPASTRGYLERIRELAEQAARQRAEAAQAAAARRKQSSSIVAGEGIASESRSGASAAKDSDLATDATSPATRREQSPAPFCPACDLNVNACTCELTDERRKDSRDV